MRGATTGIATEQLQQQPSSSLHIVKFFLLEKQIYQDSIRGILT
jgi:hypothetical protein